MKVTPLDIRRKEFKRSMRGYSDEEVDLFLDEVADEFERLFQENIELQERVQRLEEQMAAHAQLREALEKTLITAQLQADEIKANARKESELILRDAELKARDMVGESYKETQRVQQALIQLKRLEEDFRFKFRSLLEGHLKLLEEAPLGVPSREVPSRSAAQEQPAAKAAPTESAKPAAEEDTAELSSGPPELASPSSSESGADTSESVRVQQDGSGASGAAQEESGFVFGRRLSDLENGFFVPESTRDKSRDFEW